MTDIKKQTFGVEIEMNGISRQKASKVVAQLFGTNNYVYTGEGYQTWTATDALGRKWKFMRDGSIVADRDDEKCELVTPILGWNDIDMLQNVVRTLKDNGAKAHSSCGIHVHVGADEHTSSTLKNLLNLVYTHYDLLEKALQFTDRKRWCKKSNNVFMEDINRVKPTTTDELARYWYGTDTSYTGMASYYGKVDENTVHSKKRDHYDYSRYQLVNLHSYYQGKGVEFRAFNSTLHAGKVKAYVQFCCALNAKAINSAYTTFSCTATCADHENMRRWMKNMGLVGDDYKTCRIHMMKNL